MKSVFFAGVKFNSQNRGVQALGYGGVEFIKKHAGNDVTIINCLFAKKRNKDFEIVIKTTNNNKKVYCKNYSYLDILVALIETNIHQLLKQRLYNKLSKDIKNVDLVYNINGGDSFSDIYGKKQYFIFTLPSLVAILFNKKLVFLPQTIGPFKNNGIKKLSKFILKKTEVFTRDNEFENTFKNWGISYKQEVDVSCYMHAQKPLHCIFEQNSIGINISGLTYFNNYPGLAGNFDTYKTLIISLIHYFQERKLAVCLIPHTYIYSNPSEDDDLKAIKDIYANLEDKRGITIIDCDLSAPEIKYIIAQCSFFIGTRMHACFAGIFSGVNTFGLAYSYKFKGSFEKLGLAQNYYDINFLQDKDFVKVIEKIAFCKEHNIKKQ